jgi:methylase of polypeptide subunit release factors
VLDLGCGAGHASLALAAHAAEITAIDVTPDMVATASRLATSAASPTSRSAWPTCSSCRSPTRASTW